MKGITTMVLLVSSLLLYSQNINGPLAISHQEQWIDSTINQLQASLPVFEKAVPLMPLLYDLPDKPAVKYKIRGNGLIRCENGGWIYLLTHSAHEDPVVGDVTIAITGKGEVYINFSHICGASQNFRSSERKLPSSPGDFFNRFVSDIDGMGWEKHKK